MQWSIHEVATLAGTTSRALRHYDAIGLLAPSGVGANGYRRYDERALVRLQRILLLRDLGLGLAQIADVLDREIDAVDALTQHLSWLEAERERVTRQIASVASTIEALRGGESLMAEKMFDGFDHAVHTNEVEARWGADAYATGDRWWRGMTPADRAHWQERATALARDWVAAAERADDPRGVRAQELAARHVAWLRSVPGTPASVPGGDVHGYVTGLGEMYVSDERFGANYATSAGGSAGAEFVRDALRAYADAHL